MKSTLTNGVGCEGWMSELPDDVLLSKLSIPGTHNSMSYTCYEANIILKIISGLSKLGKDRLAELVSQIVELKKNSGSTSPNCPSWETYFQRNYILY